ncbi:MAG: CPBP family intramembrane glutamic endopeptidase [Candidatus Hodarchaeales archaeon]|jgi:membrane protease YdiL (CAAX protease family)
MKKYSPIDLWLRVILFFSICVILLFSFQAFVLPLVTTIFNNGENYPLPLTLNIQRAMNGVVGVGLVYVFLKMDRLKMVSVGFQWDKSHAKEWILLSIPIALIGLVPTVIIESIFEIIVFNELLDILGILVTLIVTIFAIGVGEEILFRGYLQRILQSRYSFQTSALISAFLFGFLHFWLAGTSGSVLYMVAILFSASAIGLTFSYTFKITGYNLIFPVAIHGFWDFFLFIFQADFVYDNWIRVIMEIGASCVGAAIIFLAVRYYAENYQKKTNQIKEEVAT